MRLENFEEFLRYWGKHYQQQASHISMFKDGFGRKLMDKQRMLFAAYFYHIRGHFIDFLWYMGNNAPSCNYKEIILSNIADEFSPNGRSHELLFLDFSDAVGIDLRNEYIEQKYNLELIKNYNTNHLKWLSRHQWPACFAAFSAYERLDNIDYFNLLKLVKEFELPKKNYIFFSVHSQVQHFDVTFEEIKKLWPKNKTSIIDGFTFIGEHQLRIWKSLSNLIENKVGINSLITTSEESTETLGH